MTPETGRSWRRVLRTLVLLWLLGSLVVAAPFVLRKAVRQRAMRAWEIKRHELLAASEHARPILRSLEAYRADHDTYPPSLHALVPEYLDNIPSPVPPLEGEWQYETWPHWGRSIFIEQAEPSEPFRPEYSEDAEPVYGIHANVQHDYCPKSIGGYSFGDRFAYRTDHKYPRYALGGVLEGIGDWAYYHE